MSKRDKYVQELAKTTFVAGLTSSMVSNELCARALLKILMDKGIVTNDEWIAAIKSVTESFVSRHIYDFEDLYEPDFISFVPAEDKTRK